MLAHLHGQQLHESTISESLGLSVLTVKKYIAVFEDMFLVRQLRPYYVNIGKRLIKSPKIYVCDSGILHGLINITTMDHLLSHPKAGASWEGFVIDQIINCLGKRLEYAYYRTVRGAEADVVIHAGGKILACAEIKLSLSPKISRGFMNALDDLGCEKGYCIYPGKDSYSINDRVSAIALIDFIGCMQQV
jgi:hypothetical protein